MGEYEPDNQFSFQVTVFNDGNYTNNDVNWTLNAGRMTNFTRFHLMKFQCHLNYFTNPKSHTKLLLALTSCTIPHATYSSLKQCVKAHIGFGASLF